MGRVEKYRFQVVFEAYTFLHPPCLKWRVSLPVVTLTVECTQGPNPGVVSQIHRSEKTGPLRGLGPVPKGDGGVRISLGTSTRIEE